MAAIDSIHETVAAVYVSDSRRVLATLIRLLGDFDVAEEALHDAFKAALEQWPREGVPDNPRAWLVSVGRFKAIDSRRRRARFDALDEVGETADVAVARPGGVGRRREHRGRSAPPDLHLLPSGARARGADRAHAARGLRPDDRGDRARLPDARADPGPAHRPREGQDPRRAHPVRGSGARRAARSARRGAARRSISCSTRATRPRRARP